ncbi:MYND finger domain-like protein [Mycena kentingensis (nom. inval.)]|nr:MYND finger domain-like protein [Mycena kentingensis (nom. inval.)]
MGVRVRDQQRQRLASGLPPPPPPLATTPTMPSRRPNFYSLLFPPRLSLSELVQTTLSHDSTDALIDRWLEHRGYGHDVYYEWFKDVRERKQAGHDTQNIVWNKGEFVPENIFCRTVDTGRLIPLDRTWTTHLFHHRSLPERNAMPIVFTMLPELMLLRGMHDAGGCDEIYILVTDLKRQEMDQVTAFFKLVVSSTFGRTCKPSVEQQIQYEHMRISHALARQRRTPCFPQIDLTFRALLYEKRPPFIVLFSNQPTSYSQILFTHPAFVPSADLFFDYPTGCLNPCCTDDCEIIRFPRRGPENAQVLDIKRGGRYGKRVRRRQMCNWIDCDVCFDAAEGYAIEKRSTDGSSEGSESSVDSTRERVVTKTCSKCRLVKYCSLDHQRKDWEEHRRVCAKGL